MDICKQANQHWTTFSTKKIKLLLQFSIQLMHILICEFTAKMKMVQLLDLTDKIHVSIYISIAYDLEESWLLRHMRRGFKLDGQTNHLRRICDEIFHQNRTTITILGEKLEPSPSIISFFMLSIVYLQLFEWWSLHLQSFSFLCFP